MFPTFRASTLPTALSALLGVMLVSCGKSESVAVVEPVPEMKPATAKPKLDDELLAALAPAPGDATSETSGDLEAEAQRVMALYPDKNAQELLNVPEVNPQLVAALKDLAADPQLQAAINKSVDLAAHFKGLTGAPGAYKLNLDVKAYDGPRTQRMLTSVLAGKAKPIVQFLVDELGEASFEFSFTGTEKTANGISLEPNPGASASSPPADPD